MRVEGSGLSRNLGRATMVCPSLTSVEGEATQQILYPWLGSWPCPCNLLKDSMDEVSLAARIVYAQGSQEEEDWEKRECRSKCTEFRNLSVLWCCPLDDAAYTGGRGSMGPESCWSAFLLWLDSGLEVPTRKKAVCIQMIHECVWCRQAWECRLSLKGRDLTKGRSPFTTWKEVHHARGQIAIPKGYARGMAWTLLRLLGNVICEWSVCKADSRVTSGYRQAWTIIDKLI